MSKGMKTAVFVALLFILILLAVAAVLLFRGSKNTITSNGAESNSSKSEDAIKYTLKLSSNHFEPNVTQDIKFSILNQTGEVQKQFVQKDTKMAYIFLLRTDINKLTILEPEYNVATGEFIVKNYNFGADANYRMFVNFKAQQMRNTLFEQHEITIKTDITVGNKALYKVEAFGDVRASEILDGVTINLDGWREGKGLNRSVVLSFNKGGTAFKDAKSLNDMAARVYAFRQGGMDLAFINSEQIVKDKDTGDIKFNILFPKEGIYKLFVELNINDKRQIGTFVVDVKDLK
ncbi:MAG: hypothetical protein WAS94_00375 [Candidatus Saccharimonadales bacterium]|jgi:hypothetical protein